VASTVSEWNAGWIRDPYSRYTEENHSSCKRCFLDLFRTADISETATRNFETEYWKTIERLATGRFLNKDNADCVDDPPSRKMRKHRKRDLEALGDWLSHTTVEVSRGMGCKQGSCR